MDPAYITLASVTKPSLSVQHSLCKARFGAYLIFVSNLSLVLSHVVLAMTPTPFKWDPGKL